MFDIYLALQLLLTMLTGSAVPELACYRADGTQATTDECHAAIQAELDKEDAK